MNTDMARGNEPVAVTEPFAAMLGHTPIAGSVRAVLETSIVIKNAGDRYQETPFNLT